MNGTTMCGSLYNVEELMTSTARAGRIPPARPQPVNLTVDQHRGPGCIGVVIPVDVYAELAGEPGSSSVQSATSASTVRAQAPARLQFLRVGKRT